MEIETESSGNKRPLDDLNEKVCAKKKQCTGVEDTEHSQKISIVEEEKSPGLHKEQENAMVKEEKSHELLKEQDNAMVKEEKSSELYKEQDYVRVMEENNSFEDSFFSRKGTFIRVSEPDVGITEYISDLAGYNAVMKARYSDFLVNEINKEGNVVRLTNLEKPRDPEEDFQVSHLLSQETVDQIQDLKRMKIHEVKIEVTDKDKNTRKEIHVAVRQKFQGLDSSTEDKDDKKYIVIKRFKKNKGRRFKPTVAGNYLHFVLYKENRDTMDTINNISSFLRVMPKAFSYAGSKDKRGKTSQMVSAYKLSPDTLLTINKQFNMIKVGNIEYANNQLKLGDLSGNLFVLILRQLDGSPELVEKTVSSLGTNGFINYYGLQRFGTSSVPTHSIGRNLLLGDWKKAIDLILTPKPADDKELATAKKIWLNTKNARLALRNLGRTWSIEGKLLSGLSTADENDMFNALNAVPRNMRLMYIHSYQSYIWNKVASRRIKEYGLKVLKGDLVLKEKEVCVDNSESIPEEENRKTMLTNMVKVISSDEVEKYSIRDVLLPLPGHSVVFPENETKEWYDIFLKEDGMSWSNFDSKIKTYALSGAYRKLIVVPSDVKFEILQYSDVTESLVPSDLDVLLKRKISTAPESSSLRALKLEFKLPPASYATMAVREVTKQSSSYAANFT